MPENGMRDRKSYTRETGRPAHGRRAGRRWQTAAVLATLLILVFSAASGSPLPTVRFFPRHYDFLANFPTALVQAPDPTYIRAGEWIYVDGEKRLCLFEHPDSNVTFPNVEVHEHGRLEFAIGIHEDAWDQPGNGVTFIVEVVDEAGQAHHLYERHLDPYQRPADRGWFAEQVDLEAFAGQRLQIVFRTASGGDPRNDWAAWSTPYLTSWERIEGGKPIRLNLLFITLDTVRADHLSAYGYDRQTSPTLDRLAAEGTRFTQAYSHIDLTNPSHLTMLSGLYPRSHGILNNTSVVPLELRTVPERLQEAGYHTVGIVSAYHLGPGWNMDQGFADFYPPTELRRPAATTTDIALEWLSEHPQAEPFFMWVHYFDPHAPYLPPAPYDTLYDPAQDPMQIPLSQVSLPADWSERYGNWPAAADVAAVVAQYDGAIAYTDDQLARLFTYLEETGLADRTIMIVTADHGEGLGEHGVAFDHYGLHEEVVHIPLIVRVPGRLPLGLVQEPIGHIHLAPTFLDLLGFPVPQELPGTSLVPVMEGRPWRGTAEIVMQQQEDLAAAVHTADWQLILQRQDEAYWPLYPLHAGGLELYDQRADPGQEHNLWPAPPPVAQQAQEALVRLLARWEERTAAASGINASLDEEMLELLRQLGY